MSDILDYQQRCVHLTCKSMEIYGEDFEDDPEYQDGLAEFWCTETFKNQGPDGESVGMDTCCNQERECFQEFIEFRKENYATEA